MEGPSQVDGERRGPLRICDQSHHQRAPAEHPHQSPVWNVSARPQRFASNPSVRNIDPRIGLAYDPFGDHKTSIRAGFGIFFDPIRARSYASGYYFNPPYAFAFVPLPQFPNPFPALPPPAQLVGADYHTNNTPRMYQWNFNIQRQLFESTSLTVGYVGSRGLHLYAARDINPVQPTVA